MKYSFLLRGSICFAAATSSSSEHQITVFSREESKVSGIFQNDGRLAEPFSLPKGSPPLSTEPAADTTQLPFKFSSIERNLSHIMASILTIFLFASISYCAWFRDLANSNSDYGIVVLFMIAAFYFVEAASSSTSRYLRNAVMPDEVDKYLESMKAVIPRVIWDIECYHHEIRQYTDTKGTKDDDDYLEETRTETHKVVTHRASAEYVFQSCKDGTDTRSLSRFLMGSSADSKSLEEPLPLPKQFIKISLAKLLFFADDATFNDYTNQEVHFRCLHQNRDTHYTFSSRLVMDGFKPKILVLNHRLGGPGTGLIRNLWYWVFTCMGMTVPYRIWFSRHCASTEITITKEVK